MTGQPQDEKLETDQPHLLLDPEGQPETADEDGGRDPARVEPVLGREAKRREVSDGVVDQDGEGAEGSGGANIADQRDGGHQEPAGPHRGDPAGPLCVDSREKARGVTPSGHREKTRERPSTRFSSTPAAPGYEPVRMAEAV